MRDRALLLALLFTALVLAGCDSAPVKRGDSPRGDSTQLPASQPQEASPDSILEILTTTAATDFHANRSSDPGRFRAVRLGYIMTPRGERQYMLCGEFMPSAQGGAAEWTPFATIRTSPYEQWLGRQAASLCQDPSVIWDQGRDWSSLLQRRLDSLR